MAVRLFFLGAPSIERDGQIVAIDTRKGVALLAYLAVTGQPHTRDALAGLLWGDLDQMHARGALRRTLSAIRSAAGNDILENSGDNVRLVSRGEIWADVVEYCRLLAASRSHHHAPGPLCPTCVEGLSAAAKLYRDDFLAGFGLRDSPDFEQWQIIEAESLRRELAEALAQLVQHHGATGALEDAISQARRWLALDPLREEAHRELMRLYSWNGDRNLALRQYRECLRILEEELGVAPLTETTQLYQAIRENKLPPSPAPQRAFKGPAQSPYPSAESGPDGTRASAEALTVHPLPVPLTGRASEWTALAEAYEKHAPSGFFVGLRGEAGIGKTRLAEELAAHVQRHGALAISTCCYEGEGDLAYAPLVGALRALIGQAGCTERLKEIPPHWLAEVARLLPELPSLVAGLAPASPAEGPAATARFLEGIRQALLGLCPGYAPTVLFFDDMQWADAASLNVLFYLVHRLAGSPLFVLASWRPDGSPQAERMDALASEAQRARRGFSLSLGRLSLDDVREMLRALDGVGTTLPDALNDRLYRESEGLPFFVVAYLEAIVQAGRPADTPPGADWWPAGGREWSMPTTVRDLLRARLQTAGETGLQLLQAAAVLGRSFELDTLQHTSGRSLDETVTEVEGLVARGLIHELRGSPSSGPTYDFSHEKLRAFVYEETSLARRRLLHRRAAQALLADATRRHHGDPLAALIAHHYRLAGQDAEAAQQYAVAAGYARTVHANAEALAHLQTALALGHPDPARLHETAGDLYTMQGQYRAALQSYELAASSRRQDSPMLAVVEHQLANVHSRLGEWALAESHFAAADRLFEASGDASSRARLYADWSLASHRQGDTDRAVALAGAALARSTEGGDQQTQAQAHNILGILARSRGDLTAAMTHGQNSLELAQFLDDPLAQVAALNNLALTAAAVEEKARALSLTGEALALCARLGDRHREAALHNNMADLLHSMGQSEEAMAHLKIAAVIFAEIGAQAGDAQPEIWKLTEW